MAAETKNGDFVVKAKMDLKLEVQKLERIFSKLEDAAASQSDSRQEIVDLRKSLSLQLPMVTKAASLYFSAVQQPTLESEFRQRLSSLRATVALHQANWPAIKIDRGHLDYLESAKSVASARRTLVDWTIALCSN